jgi:hypothetical protein
MYRKKNIRASDLSIDLQSFQERELFRWFLACLLFGKPIQQEIARRAFLQLDEAGLDSPQAILDIGWDGLVDLLDRAHYVRYDFSTATKLLDVSNALIIRYGTLKQMITQSPTPAELAKMMQEFKGIGPVTAGIFLREVRPIWKMFKREITEQTGRQNMNREPRRIPPKLLPMTQKRRPTREVAALPKGSKEIIRGGIKGKTIPFSPS